MNSPWNRIGKGANKNEGVRDQEARDDLNWTGSGVR